MANKIKTYLDQSKTVKKRGQQVEKIPTGIGNARKNLQGTKPGNVPLKTLKFGGIAGLAVLQALFKALKIGTVDNIVLRTAEIEFSKITPTKNKKGNDKKFSSFLAKYPGMSSYLMYYMIAAMTFGGYKANEVISEYGGIGELIKSKKEKILHETEKYILGNKLDPASQDFLDLCKTYENLICIPIIYTETYRATPKVQAKENVWTHGFGMTWSPDTEGHMTIRDYTDTAANIKKGYKPHKPKMQRTKDADLEETKQFLIDHIYPKIKKNMTREIAENELYALCVAGYQLEGHIPTICKQLSEAKTPQQIADAFITPTMYQYGGTPKRRWICGMLAAGYITLQDVVEADIDAFYIPDINTFIRNGKFICNEATIKYVLSLKRHGTTKAVLEQLKDGNVSLALLKGEKKAKIADFRPPTVEEAKISTSMEILMKAEKEYAAKKYIKAAELFQQAIESDPDNMEAYSSLALVYKKLGDEKKSINYYQKSLDVVVACNARMNANRTLLMDHAVKGSSYYNAGLSREAMAGIYKKKGNPVEAGKNYSWALKNFQNALYNYEQLDGFETNKEVYKKAIDRMKKAIETLSKNKSKTLSFNVGRIKVKGRPTDKKTLQIQELVKDMGRA
ncbi:MAG: tetratricopeptide repeat protein [Rickettsiales bacterium]|jgi:tetratricopeptide (TPR) repeat protein|nr:tetratricopeptide repeat protein [Rickettsiales bacterium]